MSYEDYSKGEIAAVYGQRNKGHIRVEKFNDRVSFNPRSHGINVSYKDSWRGQGPYAEMTRSVLLHNGLTGTGNVHYNEKLFTENSRNAYPQGISRHVVPLNKSDPGIRRLQLAILLQHHPNQIAHMNGGDMDIDDCGSSQPVTLLAPAVWQEHIVKSQIKMWQRDRAEYRRLEPRDVFRGWKIDGIVDRDDLALGMQQERVRELTMIIKDLAAVRSYWRYARCGSRVGVVIKKWHTNRMLVVPDAPEAIDEDAEGGEAVIERVPMTPFTLGFWSTTYGAEPSARIFEYTDDDGYEKSDALVIELGTVQDVPMGNYPRDQIDYEYCEPYDPSLELQIADQYTPMHILLDIKYK